MVDCCHWHVFAPRCLFGRNGQAGTGARDTRETDALNNGFWVSALPDHVNNRAVGDKWKNTDGFFHSSVVIATRPL